eukprot:GFKZ01003491.1.p1 GENE.GFKZ01003491.1~~GFKZ01003491.1.p1  ORF type:complete len:396 (-),score=18.68 GFKZ01003491.1:306-1493(-)
MPTILRSGSSSPVFSFVPHGPLSPRRSSRHSPIFAWAPTRQLLTCTAQSNARAFWVLPQSKGALTTALEGNIHDFIFTKRSDLDDWSSLGRFNAIYIDTDGLFQGGLLTQIKSPTDVTNLTHLAGTSDIIIIDSNDWKIIPTENLIAHFQNTATKLFAMVDSVQEAKAMFGMLQTGVDGCVLRSGSELEISSFASLKRELVDHAGLPLSNMSTATITTVRPVGAGERVCIDTCSLLSEHEGLLVGSSSQSTFLVLSEAAQVSYISPRPFRINAGPVHSYCLIPGGKTKYLCELSAGDEVLIIDHNGSKCRTAVVGRSKIETRPLLLVEATRDDDGKPCTVFVQNAETVRLAAVDASNNTVAKSVTTLTPGDRVILRSDSAARHCGIAIEEDLVEQ